MEPFSAGREDPSATDPDAEGAEAPPEPEQPAATEAQDAESADVARMPDPELGARAGAAAEPDPEAESAERTEPEPQPDAEPEPEAQPSPTRPTSPTRRHEPDEAHEPEAVAPAPAEPTTVAELVAATLRAAGVRIAFTVAGESFLGILDALTSAGIRVVATRHEGAAAFAAEAYGQLTGRPGGLPRDPRRRRREPRHRHPHRHGGLDRDVRAPR